MPMAILPNLIYPRQWVHDDHLFLRIDHDFRADDKLAARLERKHRVKQQGT